MKVLYMGHIKHNWLVLAVLFYVTHKSRLDEGYCWQFRKLLKNRKLFLPSQEMKYSVYLFTFERRSVLKN